MMLESFGQAALRTFVLAAVVQLGLVLLQVKGPQLRLVAWTVVLAASLAMPALQWAIPLQLPVLPGGPGLALTEVAVLQWQTSVLQTPLSARGDDVTASTTSIPWLETLYFLVASILLMRLVVGIALSLRLVGKAESVRPGWAGGTKVRISPDITAPVTVANVVLLPSSIVDWTAAMRDAVLAHERAHIARWDFAMLLAAQLNQALFWFSPFSWWLHRRLAGLAELASDDLAMAATGDRPGYAEVLLEMGRRSGPLLRGVAMARPATLQHRIERILSDRVPVASATPFQQTMLTASAASLSIIAAISCPVPAPSLDAAPPRPSLSWDEQRQPAVAAELHPPGPALVEQASPGPTLPPPTGKAFQDAARLSPIFLPAIPSNVLALRGAPQTIARLATRNTLPAVPSRPIARQIRAGRYPGANVVPSSARSIIPAGFGMRSTEGPGIASGVGADGRASLSLLTARPPAAEPPPPRRVDEPSCTGVYLPRSGGPRMDGQADLLQANYYQALDGTPWLKLFFGSRSQARLNGFDVERTSVRTTVVATLPTGTNRMTGTSHGAFGTIDYECIRPNARL